MLETTDAIKRVQTIANENGLKIGYDTDNYMYSLYALETGRMITNGTLSDISRAISIILGYIWSMKNADR